jgi:hypothetical protein
MGRKTIVLGVTAVAAVTAAVIVTVAKNPGPSAEHKAVAHYIEQVDAIEQQLRVQLTKATTAYRDFGGAKANSVVVVELVRAERTMQKLERNLRSVPAPPVAARLKKLISNLAVAEVALAHEVAELARFSPNFTALVRAATNAGKQLGHALASVSPPTAHAIHGTKKEIAKAREAFRTEAAKAAATQADAVDAYDAQVAVVASKLRKLHPPAVMEPSYRTELRTLVATRKAGRALANELRKIDRSDLAVVGRRFTIAARGATTVAAQRAQIAAVSAYNKRVRAIGAMQAGIQRELARVQSVTG